MVRQRSRVRALIFGGASLALTVGVWLMLASIQPAPATPQAPAPRVNRVTAATPDSVSGSSYLRLSAPLIATKSVASALSDRTRSQTLPVSFTGSVGSAASINHLVASVHALRVPIMLYHYISVNQHPRDTLRTALSVTPDDFAAQLRYLSDSGYTAISLDDYLAACAGKAALPARPIILSFDDGYRDFYINAYPLLQRYHMRATIYVITDKVGQANYMTWAQLRELAASPLITIGAHTRNHVDLTAVSLARARDEIVNSRVMLEQRLGVPARHFAYPFGRSNPQVRELVREAGFASATTTSRRVATAQDDPLLVPRIEITGGDGLGGFRAKLRLGGLITRPLHRSGLTPT